MKASCESCGTQHILNDAQVGNRPRVQFRCSKCGETNIVDVAHRPDRTQVTSPLPTFARSEGRGAGPGMAFGTQHLDLSLPADKNVTVSVIAGPSKGLVHSMTKPRVVLGRAEADIEIDDPEVSRWHCAIEVKDNVVRVRDLDSTNGTYFDDERVRVAELQHLSEFRVGSTVLLLSILPKRTGEE